MRLFLIFVIGVLVLAGVALALRTDETYFPSIAALKPNEILVMKYSACHNGCDKGTVKFRDNTAFMTGHEVHLTEEEVRDLDYSFLSAGDLADDYFCSLQILISFKKKKAFGSAVKRKTRLYPCRFSDVNDRITPGGLFYHFNETPDETPFWRLSPKQQAEELGIDLTEN